MRTFPLIFDADWYRHYTVYDSLTAVGLGSLSLVFLIWLARRRGLTFPTGRLLSVGLLLAVGLSVLYLFVYGENRPLGIDTGQIIEYRGFPKYVVSWQHPEGGGERAGFRVHWINLASNVALYLVYTLNLGVATMVGLTNNDT